MDRFIEASAMNLHIVMLQSNRTSHLLDGNIQWSVLHIRMQHTQMDLIFLTRAPHLSFILAHSVFRSYLTFIRTMRVLTVEATGLAPDNNRSECYLTSSYNRN